MYKIMVTTVYRATSCCAINVIILEFEEMNEAEVAFITIKEQMKIAPEVYQTPLRLY